MLKVLHVIQGCGGGVSSLVGNLVRSADKSQVQQDVMSFSFENGEVFVEELKQNGCKLFLLPRPRKDGLGKFNQYMLDVLRAEGYDVVHCHTDGWRAILYRRLAKKAGVPLFCVHAHRAANDPGFLGNSKLFIRLNQAISCKTADVRFACGRDAARFIFGTDENAVMIPNGIHPQQCHAAKCSDVTALKEELGIPDDRMVILQVGRLVTQKNHAFTVQIARTLKAMGIAYRLLIVGTGGLEQSIRAELEEYGLTDDGSLLGRRNDIYRLMAMADVMILPSLYEGLPTVAVEAQAMGLPGILSDTVTAECDMGLGLVWRLPIDDARCWAETIVFWDPGDLPDQERIDRILEENAYTAEGAAQRYFAALQQKQGK